MAVTSYTNSLNQRETLQDMGHEDVHELKYDVGLKMEDSEMENKDTLNWDLRVKVKEMKAEKVECQTCGVIFPSRKG